MGRYDVILRCSRKNVCIVQILDDMGLFGEVDRALDRISPAAVIVAVPSRERG
jgi:hypothetical protein